MDVSTQFELTQKRALALLKESTFYLIALMPLWMILGPSTIDIALGLISVSFIYYAIAAQDYSFFSKPFVMLGLAFWLYFSVQGFLSPAGLSTFGAAVPWIRFLLLMGAAAWVINSGARLKKMLYIMLPFVLFALADTALQYFKGTDLFGIPIWAGGNRLTGPMKNPRIGHFFLVFLFPLFLFFIAQKKTVFAWIFLSLTLALIVLSGERMTLLQTFFGIGLLFLMLKSMRKVMGGFLIASIIGAVLLIATNPLLKHRLTDHSQQELVTLHNNPYVHHLLVTTKMFMSKPLFGHGPNQFRHVCPLPEYTHFNTIALDKGCALHPHNIYMQLLAESGLVGFTLFMGMLITIARYFYRHYHSDALGFALTAFLFLWPLGGMRNFFMAYGSTLIWFSLALTYAILQSKKYERTQS